LFRCLPGKKSTHIGGKMQTEKPREQR